MIALNVNDKQYQVDVDPRTPLLYVLRNDLKFNAAKFGCGLGQCGACTVLVDGRRTLSCLRLAVAEDGAEVVTSSGLRAGDDLHPMHQAFMDHDGLQCGYCTPGQICSAVGMLAEAEAGWPSAVTADLTGPVELSGAEIRERMSGNLCRCGAYAAIVPAIAEAAT
jgi:xanthine dehydrogenase YagT iron-sulfur-binding subunit